MLISVLTVNKYTGFTEWRPRNKPIDLNPRFLPFVALDQRENVPIKTLNILGKEF